MRNERLRRAMVAGGMGYEQVALKVDVDLKTVQRWVYEGRVPRRATAQRVAECLGAELAWLWPNLTDGRLNDPAGSRDLFELYPSASGLPDGFWHDLVSTARRDIWVLTDSEWLLAAIGATPDGVLGERAAAGLAVRLLVADTIFGQGHPGPCPPTVQVGTFGGVQATSIVRADTAMVVIPGCCGLEVAESPALYLGYLSRQGPFDRYLRGFERLWQQSAERMAAGGDALRWLGPQTQTGPREKSQLDSPEGTVIL